ncbi:Putative helicase, Zinc finger, PHD-type, Zinc finger, FYVE/PHD-type, Chromo-like domain superfamily [Septoria linicola]|uniref:Helicase, Zinc finger, PHD-type, Zinc finger, FYVE/PHD-type, Chromo-like domain superfamily n=1 Tax=Septoria linicola TaxID=215465 RepID=A0A9Q9AY54_9PEZI|nr:Putative helicase, Zinc finger, PHD-type, Zinc finger, FYVE/PHD-type, Chromo-like domain superfamily [Septoria linicola]
MDSDDSDVDLGNWGMKGGVLSRPKSPPPPPRAPVAPMVASSSKIVKVVRDSSSPEILESAPKSQKSAGPVPSFGFNAINGPAQRASEVNTAHKVDSDASSEADTLFVEGEDASKHYKGKGKANVIPSSNTDGKLVVEISRTEADNVDLDDFLDYRAGGDRVRQILSEHSYADGTVLYKVQFDDYHDEDVTFNDLLDYDNGEEAINEFNDNGAPVQVSAPQQRGPRGSRNQRSGRMLSSRPNAGQRKMDGFVSTVDAVEDSDEDLSENETMASRLLRGRKRKHQDVSPYVEMGEPEDEDEEDEEDDSDDELQRPTRAGLRTSRRATEERSTRTSRRSTRRSTGLTDDDEESDSDNILTSDLAGGRRRKRGRPAKLDRPAKKVKIGQEGERHSSRATRHVGGMTEIEVDDIYRSESDEPKQPSKPKPVGVREIFQDLPRNNEFRMRHSQYCDVCGQGQNFSKLIYCQGCSLVYHKPCLGHRTNREHLVTKVDEDDFVLQCRRCVGFPRRKDPTAPDHGKCQECKQHGAACRPFRSRKSPAQEQRDREENDGVDPVYDVPSDKINNVDNVMFRCTHCFRGFHFEHLPSRTDYDVVEIEADPEQRFREYNRDWKCKDCAEMPAKVSGLIAWKPIDEDIYDPAQGLEGLEEEDKVYLVRWDGMSYFRAKWMPGTWVWGVTPHVTRKAFSKRDDSQHPKMRTEDAIPEDYLRTDIVLDVKYTSIVDINTQEIDKARNREVEKALIKYKGLTYEDAVWEAPPGPEDGDRWTDFVTAYNDWVAGRYVRQPKVGALKTRLEKIRKEDFRNLEKTVQPETLEGGKLMEYQIQGLNWLYYKWFTQKNAILADEMGLGKTIQIIGFLATLVQEHNCYPFLVVVPNSTCPNWRREIKRWAPSLRVVAYYGSRESRDLAWKHELYPDGAKDLRCHVVVTSYDAAADENCRKFFKGVPWQGLIVDEGQRLKNDKNLLYSALAALKCPFKILLTGTPLQNNQRELFNLLHFLDDSFDAAALELEFAELDHEKIGKLHDMIKPFFLRRTKAQVLTFLPPMAQIIIPVSMSIVQKKLYRSILAKNPDLMKALFSADANLKQGERASLSNILMQLRKCLCHPFVYNKSIEDRHVDLAASHRNLVDASSKLKLLELLLPKLKERGHRVLIFSQFLEMLDCVEDFMDGMQLRYQRLDGQISSLVKQKRIDEFNAPDSPLFAFLLSTRAGGVGINLATADTVIILDPDFNPHQDIQALSRAHRIGQQKKVLCFQMVTRASAEERIMQIGRKKLALDHVLIQEMDADDAEQTDLVSVLRHGASELFEEDGEQDIVYDSMNVERLLDRSHMEDTKAGEDKTAETQFSFARVWANGEATLQDAVVESEESAPDPGVWANILKERERIAAEEATAKAEAFGRGRRARERIDYAGQGPEGEAMDITPLKRRKKKETGGDSDTDFQADDSDDDAEDPGEDVEAGELMELERPNTKSYAGKIKPGKTPQKAAATVAAKAVNSPAKAAVTPSKAKPKAVSVPKATPKKAAAMPKQNQKMVQKPSTAKGKTAATPKQPKTQSVPNGRGGFNIFVPEDTPSKRSAPSTGKKASKVKKTSPLPTKTSDSIVVISDDEDTPMVDAPLSTKQEMQKENIG